MGQFSHAGDPTNPHLLENHEEQSVVYTGTHDNDTTLGWWRSLDEGQRAWLQFDRHLHVDPHDPAWSLLRAAWRSRAALAVAPLQDVLRRGSEARMNLPGTEVGNWQWRYEPDDLTDDLAGELREVTRASGRERHEPGS